MGDSVLTTTNTTLWVTVYRMTRQSTTERR